MKVLLVEPKKSKYYNLALMKFSAYHKAKGDEVMYVEGFQYFIEYEPDVVYITSLFSWDFDDVVRTTLGYKNRFPNADIKVGGIMASLDPKGVEEATGIKPHFGLYEKIDQILPDYDLFPDMDYSISMTTRSCTRKCGWCPTWRLEGEFRINKQWENMIDQSKPKIVFFDNNFLAADMSHIREVLGKAAKWGKPIDFNQSVDARYLTDEMAELFSKTKINPMRFAFDSMDYDGEPQKAIKMCKKYGISDFSADVLYNFNDTPEDFWYRCKELVLLHCDAYPMRFQPLTTKKKDLFIGKNWTTQTLKNFRAILMTYMLNAVIGRGAKNKIDTHPFWRVFGKTPEEFRERIETYHTNPEIVPCIKKEKPIEIIKDERSHTIREDEAEIQELIKKYGGAIDRAGAIKILENK